MNLIITDGLLGNFDNNPSNIKVISKEGLKLESVSDVLKGHTVTIMKNSIVVVSVGSWNVTGSYQGWEFVQKPSVEKAAELIAKAAEEFKKSLISLRSVEKSKKCKIFIASLIPLADEQNCDEVSKENCYRVSFLSSLFVEVTKLIEDFNNTGKKRIAKFVTLSKKRKYLTRQQKINTINYDEEGIPKAITQEKTRRKLTDFLLNHTRKY